MILSKMFAIKEMRTRKMGGREGKLFVSLFFLNCGGY